MDTLYTLSACSPVGFPMRVLSATARSGQGEPDIFFNADEHWEELPRICVVALGSHPLPSHLSMQWLSVVERKCYRIDAQLDVQRMERLWQERDERGANSAEKFANVVIGLAPFGGVALWLAGRLKWQLVQWLRGEAIATPADIGSPQEVESGCRQIVEADADAKKTVAGGLPQSNLFELRMKQYRYRYVALEEFWDGERWQHFDEEDEEYDTTFADLVMDTRYDGSRDQLGDGSLMRYHEAARPRRIGVKWNSRGTVYAAFFWLDDKPLATAFERIMMMDPSAGIDVHLRLDPVTLHFALALTADVLPKPIEVPQEAFQTLVFSNSTEIYRSDNYDQPGEAWLW